MNFANPLGHPSRMSLPYRFGWEPRDFYIMVTIVAVVLSVIAYIVYGSIRVDQKNAELLDQLTRDTMDGYCDVVGMVPLPDEFNRLEMRPVFKCKPREGTH